MSYRRELTWEAGETGEKSADIGSPAPSNIDTPASLGLLRVGYSGDVLGPALDGTVQPSDNGTVIGPIDVPFSLVAEQPFLVRFRLATPQASVIRLALSVVPVASYFDRIYATKTRIVNLNDSLVLPQWVRGVSAVSPCSFHFLNRVGVAISANGLTGAHDRPAMASELFVDAAGTLVLYY
jgi:hypothetical protein